MKNKFQILVIALVTLIFTNGYSKTTTFNGTTWNNGVPAGSADVVIITGGTYSLPANITYSSLTLNGGNFNVNGKTFGVGNITLTSGTMSLGGTNVNPSGNISLGGGTLNLGGATMNLGGNITVTAASTIQSTGLSRLDATGNTLTINGGALLLNNVEVVIDDLTFTTSHDINSSNGGFLAFDASQNHNINGNSPGVATNAAHVNAKVRLYTSNGNSNTFYFPIGNGTVYSPFIFDPNNVPNSGTAFTHWVEATYFGAKASQTALDLTSLNNASGYEYWTVASSSTSITGRVALRYDNNASKTGLTVVGSVTNLTSDLKLAQYNTSSSKWVGIASSNAANSPSSGITTSSSTSTTINPTSNWTLASSNSRTSFLVPLPVSLINFDVVANKTSKSVEVKWTTASEENNSHFEIMHSTDFVNWTSIGTVYSKGNSNEMNVYTFTDLNPQTINNYKLKIVANNGEVTYTSIKLAKFTETVSATVNVFPNPANANVNLSVDNMDMTTPVTIQLVNPMGQVVFEQIITENLSGKMSTSIPTLEFAAGIYQVTISGTTGTVSQKLIINH